MLFVDNRYTGTMLRTPPMLNKNWGFVGSNLYYVYCSPQIVCARKKEKACKTKMNLLRNLNSM